VAGGGTCGPRSCWKETKSGYGLRDSAGAGAGITHVTLKGGVAGKVSVAIKAKGASLPLPTAGGETYLEEDPVVVQLSAADAGGCWESRLATSDGSKNTAGLFKAKR